MKLRADVVYDSETSRIWEIVVEEDAEYWRYLETSVKLEGFNPVGSAVSTFSGDEGRVVTVQIKEDGVVVMPGAGKFKAGQVLVQVGCEKKL